MNVVITSVITQIVMFKQRLKNSLSGEGNVRRLHRFSLWRRKCATFTQILSLEKEMFDVYTDSLSGKRKCATFTQILSLEKEMCDVYTDSLSGEGNVRRLHRFSLWRRKCATFIQILSLEKELRDVYTVDVS